MADEDKANSQTLKNNDIKKFVIRIDLLPNDSLKIDTIIGKLSPLFDRIEKRIVEGVSIEITNGQPAFIKTEDYDFVLVSEKRNLSMTFSKAQFAFWLETGAYRDNSTYKDIFEEVKKIFYEVLPTAISKRMGMRFINEFKCQTISEIKKVFKLKKANIVIGILDDKDISRAIAYQEYNIDGKKTRVQYGIANKYYPAVISSYDLVLDIDAYFDTNILLEDWNAKISDLNHTAYKYFIETMNEKYILDMQ